MRTICGVFLLATAFMFSASTTTSMVTQPEVEVRDGRTEVSLVTFGSAYEIGGQHTPKNIVCNNADQIPIGGTEAPKSKLPSADVHRDSRVLVQATKLNAALVHDIGGSQNVSRGSAGGLSIAKRSIINTMDHELS